MSVELIMPIDMDSMTLNLDAFASCAPIEVIRKNVLTNKKQAPSKGFESKDYDLMITSTTQSQGKGINISFGNPIFRRYDYITFYPLRDMLFFELSNTYKVNMSYSISRNTKESGSYFLSTKVAGEGFEKLLRFIGTHTMKEYTGYHNDEYFAMFFITLPYSLV